MTDQLSSNEKIWYVTVEKLITDSLTHKEAVDFVRNYKGKGVTHIRTEMEVT